MPSFFQHTLLTLTLSLGLTIASPPVQAETDEELAVISSVMLEFMQATLVAINQLPGDCAKLPKTCTDEEIAKQFEKAFSSSPFLKEIADDMPMSEMAGFARYLATKAKPEQMKKLQQASQTYAQAVKEFQKEVLGDQSQAMLKMIETNQQKAKISSVKANMHTIQTMVETYAVDWGGTYAPNMAALQKEAKKQGMSYWKDFTNPFTGKTGVAQNGSVIDYSLYKNAKSPKDFAGLVLYEPLMEPKQKQIVGYKIYGCDQDGKLIMTQGQTFYLTNY